ncbi:UNVERIFIED_CONTAM: hypothetical protein RKD50_007328 [Streptomyces canus]
MNGSALHQTAADCAEELPGAKLDHPFGPAWEVYKVCGKVFMLMTDVPGRPVVILKASSPICPGPSGLSTRTPTSPARGRPGERGR